LGALKEKEGTEMSESGLGRASEGDAEVPEADRLEQQEAVIPEAPPEMPAIGVEVPEADALEQEEPVGGEEPPGAPIIGLEVPEADALEQAREVPFDEDEDR
jgi:hypothetical protein